MSFHSQHAFNRNARALDDIGRKLDARLERFEKGYSFSSVFNFMYGALAAIAILVGTTMEALSRRLLFERVADALSVMTIIPARLCFGAPIDDGGGRAG